MNVKIDAAIIDLAEEGDEVLERTTKAIDGPASDEVDLFPRHHGHEPIICGTLIPTLGSRDTFIGQPLDDDPAHALGDGIEFTKLVRDRLSVSAHPCVDRDPLAHGWIIPWRASK